MVPLEELDRALAKWRARVHGHGQPAAVVVQTPVTVAPTSVQSATRDEATQVVHAPYQGGESGNVVAEVNLDDGDIDYSHESVH